jgi:hypothetical protein
MSEKTGRSGSRTKTLKPLFSIRLLKNEQGETVGFKASIPKTEEWMDTKLCEWIADRASSIVVKIIEDSLIFDDSLNRGLRWIVPIAVAQREALGRLFNSSSGYPAVYPQEGYIVRGFMEESLIGFLFVNPKCIEVCLSRLSESDF